MYFFRGLFVDVKSLLSKVLVEKTWKQTHQFCILLGFLCFFLFLVVIKGSGVVDEDKQID